MKAARKCIEVFCLLVILCIFRTSVTYSQSGRVLEGIVVDQAGGQIAGAKVTLFSDDRVRTATTDGDGEFRFTGLVAPVHYLEASSAGFFIESISLTDIKPDRVSITLSVGECTQCGTFHDVRERSVQYEERLGREQLAGTVSEFAGAAMTHTSLTLMKADLNGPEAQWPSPYRSPSMNERGFQYSYSMQAFSDEKGEFHFTGLEPGWYALYAESAGHNIEKAKFWIARETLTKLSRIEMVSTGPGQPSPFRPQGEFPLIQVSPPGEIPATIEMLPLKAPPK